MAFALYSVVDEFWAQLKYIPFDSACIGELYYTQPATVGIDCLNINCITTGSDWCSNDVCKHNSTCINTPPGDFTCTCTEGWTAKTCEEGETCTSNVTFVHLRYKW